MHKLFWSSCLALSTAACSTPPPAGPFEPEPIAAIDAAIEDAVARHALPGAVFQLERGGQVHARAYGVLYHGDGAGKVADDTVFDAASLTKVMATAPSVLLLAEDGRIRLDAPLSDYFPACELPGITIAQLLTHTSGLPAGLPRSGWSGEDGALAKACAMTPTHAPGAAFRYSDVNYILLGLLVQHVSGQTLATFATDRLFRPLGMDDTGFLPLERIAAARIAPTAPGQRGVVHDPSARRMGGVAGSAGLFSTRADVARYARMLLQGGQEGGVRVMSEASVLLLTTAQTPPALPERRAMGMDIDSPFARPRGQLFPHGSYGHTGFTGCFLWIDPVSGASVVFLSNRVYPDDKANILALYTTLGNLAARAVGYPVKP